MGTVVHHRYEPQPQVAYVYHYGAEPVHHDVHFTTEVQHDALPVYHGDAYHGSSSHLVDRPLRDSADPRWCRPLLLLPEVRDDLRGGLRKDLAHLGRTSSMERGRREALVSELGPHFVDVPWQSPEHGEAAHRA